MKILLTLGSIAIGASGGYAYYKLIGCRGG